MQDKAALQCKIKKSLEPFIIHCVEKNVPLNNYLKSKATSNKIKVRHSWIILLCCKSSVICTVWSPLFDMHLQYKRKGYYIMIKLCHCLLLPGLGARNWSVRYGKLYLCMYMPPSFWGLPNKGVQEKLVVDFVRTTCSLCVKMREEKKLCNTAYILLSIQTLLTLTPLLNNTHAHANKLHIFKNIQQCKCKGKIKEGQL